MTALVVSQFLGDAFGVVAADPGGQPAPEPAAAEACWAVSARPSGRRWAAVPVVGAPGRRRARPGAGPARDPDPRHRRPADRARCIGGAFAASPRAGDAAGEPEPAPASATLAVSAWRLLRRRPAASEEYSMKTLCSPPARPPSPSAPARSRPTAASCAAAVAGPAQPIPYAQLAAYLKASPKQRATKDWWSAGAIRPEHASTAASANADRPPAARTPVPARPRPAQRRVRPTPPAPRRPRSPAPARPARRPRRCRPRRR